MRRARRIGERDSARSTSEVTEKESSEVERHLLRLRALSTRIVLDLLKEAVEDSLMRREARARDIFGTGGRRRRVEVFGDHAQRGHTRRVEGGGLVDVDGYAHAASLRVDAPGGGGGGGGEGGGGGGGEGGGDGCGDGVAVAGWRR